MLIPHVRDLDKSHLLRGVDTFSFSPFFNALPVVADGLDVRLRRASIR